MHRLPRPSAIALDYDFTVARFLSGFDGLHQILVRQGMSLPDAQKAHEKAEGFGFTPNILLACAGELGFTPLSPNRFHAEFRQWLKDELRLYPEMTAVAEKWSGIPIHIVSFGDEQYQMAKITATCIPHVDARITKEPKAKALGELYRKYHGTIWFFDDNPHEHDGVRDAGLTDKEVICLFVDRPESPHNSKVPKYEHRRVSSLLEVHWE